MFFSCTSSKSTLKCLTLPPNTEHILHEQEVLGNEEVKKLAKKRSRRTTYIKQLLHLIGHQTMY